MRILFLLLITLGIPTLSFAGTTATVFPPEDCSTEEYRIITWQDGSTSTVCKSAQEIFHLALPDCENGEVVVFRGNEERGIDPVSSDRHQDWGRFVCEPKTGFGVAVSISVDMDYVAPSDGLLFVHVWAGVGGTSERAPTYQVLLDGGVLTYVMAQDNTVTGTYSIIHNNLTYPMRKGQVVRVATVQRGEGADVRFIALK